MKEEKYYLIMYRRIGTYGWRPLEQTEYTQKEVKKASRPSIRQRLAELSALIKRPKKDKTRHKEPER